MDYGRRLGLPCRDLDAIDCNANAPRHIRERTRLSPWQHVVESIVPGAAAALTFNIGVATSLLKGYDVTCAAAMLAHRRGGDQRPAVRRDPLRWLEAVAGRPESRRSNWTSKR